MLELMEDRTFIPPIALLTSYLSITALHLMDLGGFCPERKKWSGKEKEHFFSVHLMILITNCCEQNGYLNRLFSLLPVKLKSTFCAK